MRTTECGAKRFAGSPRQISFNVERRACGLRHSFLRRALPASGILPQNQAALAPGSGFRLCGAHRRIRFVAATIKLPAHPATGASPWRRGPVLVWDGLRPVFEVVCSGSKVFRMNAALFSLWLLFPLFLVLTSDWIGLLVVFQAMTAAARLRNVPAAKALAACSSTRTSANRVKGEYRVL